MSEEEDYFPEDTVINLRARIAALSPLQREKYEDYRGTYGTRRSLFLALSWPIEEEKDESKRP